MPSFLISSYFQDMYPFNRAKSVTVREEREEEYGCNGNLVNVSQFISWPLRLQTVKCSEEIVL